MFIFHIQLEESRHVKLNWELVALHTLAEVALLDVHTSVTTEHYGRATCM